MKKYEILGGNLPVVVCELSAGESMITESGSMSWMSPNMKMEPISGGGMKKMFGRLMSGDSAFQNRYTAEGADGMIAFASSFPGAIKALEISNGHSMIVQKSAFLASEEGVELSMHFQKKLGKGIFGGEGFIMQRLSGNGTAFVEIDGHAVEYDLSAGQEILISTGYLAAMEETCTMDVVAVKGVKNMRNLEKYKGVIPAFYACYDNEGNVSPEGVQSLTKYFVEKGVKGVYVNGSSGECIYQSVEDRKIILENVMKAAEGKLTVIAHVACNNTKDSQELARHAESLGVDAIAAIPPIYFHLPEYAIAQYWNDISAAAPNTDFVIYNIPQLAGVALTQGLFAEMRKNPNVIGVKNSSMPVQDIQMFKQAAGPDYIIFNGPDEQFMSGRVIGAEGAIGGTYGVMPELYLKLDEYVRAGKMEEAREIQYACDEIIYKMCSAHGNMYAVIKAMLKINEGLELGGVREPLPALVEEDMAIVEEAAKMVRDAKAKYL